MWMLISLIIFVVSSVISASNVVSNGYTSFSSCLFMQLLVCTNVRVLSAYRSADALIPLRRQNMIDDEVKVVESILGRRTTKRIVKRIVPSTDAGADGEEEIEEEEDVEEFYLKYKGL